MEGCPAGVAPLRNPSGAADTDAGQSLGIRVLKQDANGEI